jgi:hypothetical protein
MPAAEEREILRTTDRGRAYILVTRRDW